MNGNLIFQFEVDTDPSIDKKEQDEVVEIGIDLAERSFLATVFLEGACFNEVKPERIT